MSGTSGPMIFVKNEITKKTNKIIPTKNYFSNENYYQSFKTTKLILLCAYSLLNTAIEKYNRFSFNKYIWNYLLL